MCKQNIRKKAFTLIELLVTITIISLLSAISAAAFNDYMSKAHLTNARIFAKNLKNIALRQKTIEEKNIFTAWYTFDGKNDVNQSRPYILDTSQNKNHITGHYHPELVSTSNDTPYNIGKSLKIEGKKTHTVGLRVPKNRSNNNFTVAYWIKMDQAPSNHRGISPIQNSTYISSIKIRKNGTMTTWPGGRHGNSTVLNKKFSFNKWHYFVKSFEPNNLKVWIDGSLILSKHFESPQNLPYGHGWRYLYLGYYDRRVINNVTLLDDVMFIPYAFDGQKFY